jgi:hypothetical protein
MKAMQTIKQRAKAEVTPIPTIYEEELIKLRTREWKIQIIFIIINLGFDGVFQRDIAPDCLIVREKKK